ncbi:hypothetical protein P5G65_20475 [Paenibacillus chondroitinus]|uniref:Uncharacterized protein n=1 Tax=Paenibacillus chondroitinus TaxID=59842 RepID=A0ABU6DEV4_9BACL|nr:MULTISPECIES: hypothetical protein [Paenibacillus]MCY9661518.1 hypothetical protein [Paenibacillus anseongense]MEB4796286.1 hypothetical protein [Paenibacillus chondroitinus]
MNDDVYYDNHFNANEWFVIAMIVLGLLAVVILPKKFTPVQTLFTLLIGIVFGLIFDHTIGLPPFDLYDVGDDSKYHCFDIFSYAMYAPFGYLFIYLYKWLGLKGYYIIPYIIIWSLLSVGIEWLSSLLGVFHYKNGYRLMFSFPIYLFLQSIHYLLFQTLLVNKSCVNGNKNA